MKHNPGERFAAFGPGNDKFQGASMLLIGLYRGNRGQAVLHFLICNQDGSLRFYVDSDNNSAEKYLQKMRCKMCGSDAWECNCTVDRGRLGS